MTVSPLSPRLSPRVPQSAPRPTVAPPPLYPEGIGATVEALEPLSPGTVARAPVEVKVVTDPNPARMGEGGSGRVPGGLIRGILEVSPGRPRTGLLHLPTPRPAGLPACREKEQQR